MDKLGKYAAVAQSLLPGRPPSNDTAFSDGHEMLSPNACSLSEAKDGSSEVNSNEQQQKIFGCFEIIYSPCWQSARISLVDFRNSASSYARKFKLNFVSFFSKSASPGALLADGLLVIERSKAGSTSHMWVQSRECEDTADEFLTWRSPQLNQNEASETGNRISCFDIIDCRALTVSECLEYSGVNEPGRCIVLELTTGMIVWECSSQSECAEFLSSLKFLATERVTHWRNVRSRLHAKEQAARGREARQGSRNALKALAGNIGTRHTAAIMMGRQ